MVGVPIAGTYKLILSSNDEYEEVSIKAEKGECDGMPYHIKYPLAGCESVIFKMPVKRGGKSTEAKPKK